MKRAAYFILWGFVGLSGLLIAMDGYKYRVENPWDCTDTYYGHFEISGEPVRALRWADGTYSCMVDRYTNTGDDVLYTLPIGERRGINPWVGWAVVGVGVVGAYGTRDWAGY